MDATLYHQPARRHEIVPEPADYQTAAGACEAQIGRLELILPRVICAWCQAIIRDGSEPISHGICADCFARVKAGLPVFAPRIEVKGACIECQEITEIVMLCNGKADFLCVPCQQRIRVEA